MPIYELKCADCRRLTSVFTRTVDVSREGQVRPLRLGET